jgi:Xaa-Pro aminopeptidase
MSTPATDTVAEPDDTTPLIPPERTVVQAKPSNFLDRTYAKVIIAVSFLAVLVLAGGLAVLLALRPSPETGLSAEDITTCAWSTLEDHEWLLNAPPIFSNEFLERQNKLAATLREEGIDAYIMEPSASSLYYFNISASYSLSERPFLQILSADGSFSYLAPKFELGRMAGLKMVCKQKTVIEWKEEESPYAVLKRELGNGTTKVMVDEQARFFIASGLEAANFTVLPTSPAITSIRSVKSYAEILILKAINKFTLEVVRSLQPCIRAGVTQEAVLTAARTLFTRAGVDSGFWALVLFGEQAANPHGGSNGKALEDGEFVLIDIGSKLHGYGSDVTRTILPPHSNISAELMYMWKLVKAAQDSAVAATTEGTACSAVDARSRYVYSSSF